MENPKDNSSKEEVKQPAQADKLAPTTEKGADSLKMDVLSLLDKKTRKQLEEDPKRVHNFWDTQPVPKLGMHAVKLRLQIS